MSTPNHDSAEGFPTEEQLLKLLHRLEQFWKKRRPNLAEDLAQVGLIQIWLKGVSGWQGKNGANLLTYQQSIGKNKGYDYLREELRNERNMRLGGEFLNRAEIRMLRNPWRYEDALIALLTLLDDYDSEDGDQY
jgi:DNA-directed RNA polymerase specialized sigma24 family protein